MGKLSVPPQIAGGAQIGFASGFQTDGEPRQVAGQRLGVVNEPFQFGVHFGGDAGVEHADIELEGARLCVRGFWYQCSTRIR